MNQIDKIHCPVESLHRGLQLLDLLCGSGAGGCSLGELSEAVGLKHTTVHNLLKTLVYSGYALRLGEGRYTVGRRVRQMLDFELLNRIPGSRLERLDARLKELTESFGESLVLAVLVNGRRRVIGRTSSGQVVSVNESALTQSPRSIWTLETGLVLAAFASEEEYRELLAVNGRPPAQEGGRFLEDLLAGVREAGCASLPNASIFAMAVPVFSADGRLLAALGINQPMYRHRASENNVIFNQLQSGARRLAELWNE